MFKRGRRIVFLGTFLGPQLANGKSIRAPVWSQIDRTQTLFVEASKHSGFVHGAPNTSLQINRDAKHEESAFGVPRRFHVNLCGETGQFVGHHPYPPFKDFHARSSVQVFNFNDVPMGMVTLFAGAQNAGSTWRGSNSAPKQAQALGSRSAQGVGVGKAVLGTWTVVALKSNGFLCFGVLPVARTLSRLWEVPSGNGVWDLG